MEEKTDHSSLHLTESGITGILLQTLTLRTLHAAMHSRYFKDGPQATDTDSNGSL